MGSFSGTAAQAVGGRGRLQHTDVHDSLNRVIGRLDSTGGPHSHSGVRQRQSSLVARARRSTQETLSNVTEGRFPLETGASLVHERNLRHSRADGWITHAVSSGFNVACNLPPEDGIGVGFDREVVPAI